MISSKSPQIKDSRFATFKKKRYFCTKFNDVITITLSHYNRL
jgi:hypothetical protein